MKPLKNTTLYSRLALITSVTLVVGYFVVYAAWTNLDLIQVQSGEKITSTLMQNILNKINDIGMRTDGIYSSARNIGIGTVSPEQLLHLKGPLPYIAFQDTEDPNGSKGTITSTQNGYMYYDANQNNTATKGGHYFRTDGATKFLLSILNNGNVGIGTSTPGVKLDVIGSVKFDGVDELNWGGSTTGNQTNSFTFNHANQSSMEITAVFNHYGYINTYGAARKSLVANGPGAISTIDITNVTSAGGGSWTITKNSDTSITVTKTAGTYSGGGYYFVTVKGSSGLTK